MNDKISLRTKIEAYGTRLKYKAKNALTKTYLDAETTPTLVSNPLFKWPRNRNCVCGSGKKFKKCCLNGLARNVTIKDANNINKKLNEFFGV